MQLRESLLQVWMQNIVTYKYTSFLFLWFEHCANRCGASFAAACPKDKFDTRLQAKTSMLDVLGFTIGALYTWSAYMIGKATARIQRKEGAASSTLATTL